MPEVRGWAVRQAQRRRSGGRRITVERRSGGRVKQFFARIWPTARVRALEHENSRMNTALASTTKRAVELQAKLDELHAQKCATCESLKQTINFLVFAAGSRHPMFEGYGPTLPEPKYKEAPAPIPGPQLA